MPGALEIPRGGSAEVEVDGRRLELTRTERPMWPVPELTKADLLEYYARIAPILLAHVAGRPLRVVRFPDGVHLPGVVDSELADAPPWVTTRDRGLVLTGTASLLWVVNLAAVELHVALGAEPEAPTCVLFEITPGAGRSLTDCCAVALRLRERLTGDGLHAHVKTSGAFGLHVAVPVNGGTGPAEAREYARAAAEHVAAGEPDLITADARRGNRTRRVLLDWRPNAPLRTTVAPYSLRATLPGPGVSAPVGWDAVEAGAGGDADALHRTPHDVLAAIEGGEDPWRPVLETVQALPARG